MFVPGSCFVNIFGIFVFKQRLVKAEAPRSWLRGAHALASWLFGCAASCKIGACHRVCFPSQLRNGGCAIVPASGVAAFHGLSLPFCLEPPQAELLWGVGSYPLSFSGTKTGQLFETEERRATWETLWNAVSDRMDA